MIPWTRKSSPLTVAVMISSFGLSNLANVKRLFPTITIIASILLSWDSSAGAQEAPILPESSADYAFGDELRFSLVVHNAAGVEEITLHFRPERSTNTYEVNVPFEPGDTISTTHAIDAAALDIHPFAEVMYSWELGTTGNPQTVPTQQFTYEDDQFEWQVSLEAPTTVHWTEDFPDLAKIVRDTVDGSLKRLEEITTITDVGPVDVYVYPSSAELRSALRRAGVEDEKSGLPEWDVILVTALNAQTVESDLAMSIPYELAHLILYRVAGEQYAAIPWWLREGIAASAQSSTNPRQEQLLATALLQGNTIPLSRLCAEPQETGDQAQLATIQSTSLLSFVSEEMGSGAVPKLITVYAAGAGCNEGIERVLGRSLDDLEREWLAAMQPPTVSNKFVADVGIWILLLAGGTLLVAFLMYITRMREMRK